MISHFIFYRYFFLFITIFFPTFALFMRNICIFLHNVTANQIFIFIFNFCFYFFLSNCRRANKNEKTTTQPRTQHHSVRGPYKIPYKSFFRFLYGILTNVRKNWRTWEKNVKQTWEKNSTDYIVRQNPVQNPVQYSVLPGGKHTQKINSIV